MSDPCSKVPNFIIGFLKLLQFLDLKLRRKETRYNDTKKLL